VDVEGLDIEAALTKIEARVGDILEVGAIPFCLGGEHTVTLPAVKAALKVHPALKVIHIDAHTDLRDHYEGSRLNHATVMRRIAELPALGRIVQLGLRSGTREEFEYARAHTRFLGWGPGAERTLLEEVSDHPVYVTVDLDALDPSCLPGTGNPEPGGWMYRDMERFIVTIGHLRIVGMDVVELNPALDPSGVSSITAAKVVRELLIASG
jgi:agmatinase